jgi:HNH endonuclease
MDLSPGEQVDHKNGNKLDNRRSNLRIASLETQARNKPKHKGFSRLKGVTRVLRITEKSGGCPWRAQINLAGRVYYLGNFKTEQQAHQAYLEALCKHHGTTLEKWKREHPNCGL